MTHQLMNMTLVFCAFGARTYALEEFIHLAEHTMCLVPPLPFKQAFETL